MLLKTKRSRILGVVLMALALIIGTVIVLSIMFSPQISTYLTKKSTDMLSKSLKAEISAQEIKGNIFRGLFFSDVRIKFASGDSFFANQVSVDYDLLSIIFRKEKNVEGIKLVQPVIYLYSKPKTQESKIKLNLPLTMPLLLVNRITIQDGSIFYDDQLMLEQFSIAAKMNLGVTGGYLGIDKASFFVPAKSINVKNIQGTIDMSQNLFTARNIAINLNRSSIKFDAQLDLEKNLIDLNIKNSSLAMNEFLNLQGGLQFKGILSAELTDNMQKPNWIKGKIEYNNNDLAIENTSIPDGKGIFEFKDTTMTFTHSSIITDTINQPQLNIKADLSIKDLSYIGQAEVTNFRFPIKDLNMPIFGGLDFKGYGKDSLDMNLNGYTRHPDIESISGQASLRNKKFTVKNLRIKDRTSILNLSGYGSVARNLKPFDFNLELSNFSLNILPGFLVQTLANNLSLSGFTTGNTHIYSTDQSIAAKGNLTIKNGSLADVQFKKFNVAYDLNNINKLQGKINLITDSIIYNNNQLSQLLFSLRDSNLMLNANNWNNNSLFASGWVHNDSGINVAIDTFKLHGLNYNLSSLQTFFLGRQKQTFYVKDFLLAVDTGTIALDLSSDGVHEPTINLTCNQIDLNKVSDIMQLPHPLAGIFNLQAANISQSSIYSFQLSSSDLKIPISLLKKSPTNNQPDINIKHLDSDCLLTNDSLKINHLNIVYDQDTSKISGLVMTNANSIMECPLDLSIRFANPGTWVFFFIKDVLEVRNGLINGQGKLTGTLEKPNLSGSVKLDSTTIFLVPTTTLCSKVSGQVIFDHQKIIIKDLAGNAETGKIQANGFVQLSKINEVDTQSYHITFQNAPLRLQKEIYAIGSGTITINNRFKTDTHAETPLLLAGNIAVREALITSEFSSATNLSASKNRGLNFNLKITGDHDIWLRNSLTDVELSCDLSMSSIDNNTVFAGSLTALQGNLYYLDHILRLTSGTITFDNATELAPTLNINAELATRPIKINQNQTERVKILATLTGTLKEPHFNFTSDPAYLSESDIISYLTFNVTWQNLTASELRNNFTNVLSQKLLGYFEREVTKRLRNYIYLDYLWLETGLLTGTGAKVTVGKYIGPNLYFTYEYNIGNNVNDIFRLEYYLTKNNEIIGERDQDSRYNLKYQYKIRY